MFFFFYFIKFSNMIFFIPLGYSLPARLQSSSLNNSLLIIILKNVKYPEHLKIFWATLYILHLNHVYYGQMKRSAIKIQELFQSPSSAKKSNFFLYCYTLCMFCTKYKNFSKILANEIVKG